MYDELYDILTEELYWFRGRLDWHAESLRMMKEGESWDTEEKESERNEADLRVL